MKKIDEIRQQRAKLIEDARAYVKKAESEKRDMTAEETASYNKIMDVSLDEKQREIDALEAGEKRAKKLADEETRLLETQGRKSDPDPLTQGGGGGGGDKEFRYKVNNGREVRERKILLTGKASSPAYRSAFSRLLTQPMHSLTGDEQRALAADNDATGGFLVAPMVFAAQMIAAVDNEVFIRRIANVLPPIAKAESLGAPTRTADMDDADWTVEIGTGSEDSAMNFGRRELKPHPFAKLIKVSKKLLRSAAIDPESIVMDRMAYKKAVTEEKGFMTGSGAAQPLGIFTASNDGISTGRDFSTGNSTTAIGADGLIEAKYSLKSQYWGKAQWVFHRDAVKQIAKLKDGEGQYLWKTGITGNDPDTLLGRPVNMSEYAPNTFTTGLYVGLLGDFSQYWIVDSLDLTIQVLLELYAATNQNGYIMRAETDGQPVLEEAFARVKLA